MKNFYYFSKNKLKFVEIKNFHRKVVLSVAGISLGLSIFFIGSYIVYKEYMNPNSEIEELQTKVNLLQEKLSYSNSQFYKLNNKVDSLSNFNDYIRLSVNLTPVTEEERKVGTGGSIFENMDIDNSEGVGKFVDTLNYLIASLEKKISFEHNNYVVIKKKMEENSKLYAALPAIKPAEGFFGDRFGMRFHPILKRRRMHAGLDIVCNTGTKVYAPGNGKIKTARYSSSMGNMVVIEHGFGYTTVFGHLSKLKVKKGEKVERGNLIGLSGSTGRLSTGPHLHYEVRHNDIPLNPMNFIYDDVELFEIAKK